MSVIDLARVDLDVVFVSHGARDHVLALHGARIGFADEALLELVIDERVIFGELLPNVTSPLMVETGLRLTYSIGLIAGISFLGLGIQPPHADWGRMINENRLAIAAQPWGVLLPVLAIALLTVGTNLVTDGIARAAIGLDRGES